MKKFLIFFSVISLAVELPFISLAGKELKLWMFFSILAGIFLLIDLLKKDFSLFSKSNIFYLGLALIAFSIISLANSPNILFSLNQVLVLSMLIVLAIFWELNFNQFKNEIYSALVIGLVGSAVFALYQNIAFDNGWSHFEVMAARPNGFFPEPDWLGFYFALGGIPFLTLFLIKNKLGKNFEFLKNRIALLLLNILVVVTLLITVARSGWVAFTGGFLVISSTVLLKYLLKNREGDWKSVSKKIFLILGKFCFLVVAAVVLVQFLGLTRFDLADRFRSIVFKEHVITMALNEKTGEKIKINLEDKAFYAGQGFRISEEYLEDENVASREDKAVETMEIIKKHPITGNGLGVNQIMTNHEHNANNFFLEWWAGSGLLSLLALMIFFGYLAKKGFENINKNLFRAVLILAGMVAFGLVNLFNASNLLAFSWFYLAWLSALTFKEKNKT